MIITEAKLMGFRNLAETQIYLSENVNILIGRNGQGKTNFLEALNYPALGRSFRGNKDSELINFNSETSLIQIYSTHNQIETGFNLGFDKKGINRIKINNKKINKKTEMLGKLYTVVFDPQTVSLVREGPENKRRFLDSGIGALDKNYIQQLQLSQRIIKQKNRLLKDAKKGIINKTELIKNLKVWNQKLATHAAEVTLTRSLYCKELTPFANLIYKELSDSGSDLKLSYKSKFLQEKKTTENSKIIKDISSVLSYIMTNEIQRGRSLVGPQTDDISVTLNDIDLRTFGSQGETRTAAISMKLAQSKVVTERTKIRPVLFLDDIFSELDRSRSARFQDMVADNHQLIIASARSEDVEQWNPSNAKQWTIESGIIREVL